MPAFDQPRDERGRFVAFKSVSPQIDKLQLAALRAVDKLNRGLLRSEKLTASLSKANARLSSQTVRSSSIMGKALNTQQKTVSHLTKGYDRMGRTVAKMARELRLANRESRTAPVFGGGIGLGLPAVLSVAGLSALTAGAASYLSTLGRLRAEVSALYAIRPPNRDVSTFLSGLASATEDRVRLLSTEQLRNVTQLREQLRKTLGGEGADRLTSSLLRSIGTVQELRGFTQLLGTDINRALRQYAEFNPAGALTAFRALNQEQEQINQTADKIEGVWRNIRDGLDRFAIAFMDVFGNDVSRIIDSVAQSIAAISDEVTELVAKLNKPLSQTIGQGVSGFATDVLGGLAAVPSRGFEKLSGWFFKGDLKRADERIDAMIKQQRQFADAGQMEAARELGQQIRQRLKSRADLVAAEIGIQRSVDAAWNLTSYGPEGRGGETRRSGSRLAESIKQITDRMRELKRESMTPLPDLPAPLKAVDEAIQKTLEKQKQLEDFRRTTIRAGKAETAISEARLGIVQSIFGASLSTAAINRTNEALAREMQNLRELQRLLPDTAEGRAEQLEVEAEILSLQRRQIDNAKSIRAAYLDAVDAQAFGLGVFSKLIISREQNVGLGLAANMVRPSPFVGRIGNAQNRAEAMRFDPFRGLTTLSGRPVDTSRLLQLVPEVSNLLRPAGRQQAQPAIERPVIQQPKAIQQPMPLPARKQPQSMPWGSQRGRHAEAARLLIQAGQLLMRPDENRGQQMAPTPVF